MAFDPNQPRDDDGKWTETGAESKIPKKKSVWTPDASKNDDTLKTIEREVSYPVEVKFNDGSRKEVHIRGVYAQPHAKFRRTDYYGDMYSDDGEHLGTVQRLIGGKWLEMSNASDPNDPDAISLANEPGGQNVTLR